MEGYESDIEYTTGYYREQEPNFLALCAATHGLQTLDLEKPFTYLELGCGYGMTSLIMAANYPHAQFIAVDFNPTHIAQATSLASEAGITNVTFLEKSFAQLANDPSTLPQCDFISLHGIFTWVSDENRQHIRPLAKVLPIPIIE
jgi:tRNA G46 methylase TrmB